MEVKVLDFNGKDTGRKVESDSVFAIEPNNHAVYLDVKQYLANRQGTHKAKERAEVAGSTRKIKKKRNWYCSCVVQRIHCLKVVEQFWTKTKKLFI
jgi:ribosomal protein L4